MSEVARLGVAVALMAGWEDDELLQKDDNSLLPSFAPRVSQWKSSGCACWLVGRMETGVFLVATWVLVEETTFDRVETDVGACGPQAYFDFHHS